MMDMGERLAKQMELENKEKLKLDNIVKEAIQRIVNITEKLLPCGGNHPGWRKPVDAAIRHAIRRSHKEY